MENLGTLGMSIQLMDDTAKGFSSITSRLRSAKSGAESLNSEFLYLKKAIDKLSEKGDINTSGMRSALSDISSIIDAYKKVQNAQKETKSLGINVDTKLAEAELMKFQGFFERFLTKGGKLNTDAFVGTYGIGKDSVTFQRQVQSIVKQADEISDAYRKIRIENEKYSTAIGKIPNSVTASFSKFNIDSGLLGNIAKIKEEENTYIQLGIAIRAAQREMSERPTPALQDYLLQLSKQAEESSIRLEQLKNAYVNFGNSLHEDKENAYKAGIVPQFMSISERQKMMADAMYAFQNYTPKNIGSVSEMFAIGQQNIRQSTMTEAERKAFRDFYTDQDKAARELAKTQEKYLSNVDAEKSRLTQLLNLRDRIINSTRNARDNGVTSDAVRNSGIGAQIKAVNDAISRSRDFINGNVDVGRISNGDYATLRREVDQAKNSMDGLTKAAKDADAAQKKAAKDAEDAHKRQEQELQKLVQQYHNLSNAATKASSSMSSLKDLLYQFAPVYGIQQMVMSVIETGGEIEKQHIALQTIIGDMQEANNLFEGLKGLALQSPFTFGDLTKDVKQLAAYNVETDQLYDTTKRLADIASGLGVSFERIALAYGQVKARSWLDAKELRQFAYAGVPLLQSLADMYSQAQGKKVSGADVKKMITNRQVSFEDVQSVLFGMTDEGGKFYNMQLKQSETLLGRYMKMKDAWEIMLSGFAKGNSVIGGTFKKIIDFVTSLMMNVNQVIPVVSSLFALFSFNKLKGLGQNIIQKGQTAEMRQQIVLELQKMKNEGALTAERAQQLIIEGQITRQEAEQIGLINAETVATGRLGAAMTGISSVAKGMWVAIGGWVGVSIAAVATVATRMWNLYSDAEQLKDKANEELKDKYEKSTKINDDFVYNPEATGEAMNEQIDTIKEKIESIAPQTLVDKIFGDVKGTGKEAADFLNNELENITAALTKYQEVSNLIGNAKLSSDRFSGSLESNIKDYTGQIAAGGWKNGSNISLDQQMNEYTEKIKSWINSQPEKLRPALIEMVRSVATEGMNEVEKSFYNFKLNEALGLDNQAEFVKLAASKLGGNISEAIKKRIKEGKPLSEPMRKQLSDALNDMIRQLESDMPWWQKIAQNVLNSHPLRVQIYRQFVDENRGASSEQSYHAKKILGNVIKKYGNGVMTRQESIKVAGDVDNEKSYEDALNNIKQKREQANKDYLATKRAGNAKEIQEAKKNKDKWDKIAAANGVENDLKDPKNNGNQRDNELKALKQRIQNVEKLIALYKEYRDLYGSTEAGNRVNAIAKKEGIEGYDFSDYVGAEKKAASEADALVKKKYTQERKEYARTVNTKAEDEQRKKEKETVESIAKAHEEFNGQLQAQYQLREQIQKKYGMSFAQTMTNNQSAYTAKNGTSTMSLGQSYEQDLSNQLNNAISKSGHPEITIDAALNLSDEKLTDNFGDNTAIRKTIEQLRTERQRLAKEAVDVTIEQFDKLESESAVLERLANEHAYQLSKINSMDVMNPDGSINADKSDQQDTARKIEDIEYNRKRIEASDDYKTFTSSPQSMTKDSFEAMRAKLLSQANDELRNNIISQTQYDEKMQEVTTAISNRISAEDALTQMVKSAKIAGAYSTILNRMNSSKSNSYTLTNKDSKIANTLGKKVGDKVSRREATEGKNTSFNDLGNSVNKVIDGFDGLSKVLSPVADLFNNLGMSGLSDALSVGSDALGAASSVQSGLGQMSQMAGGMGMSGVSSALSAAGPYGAAVGAGLSIISSLIGNVDASLQEEIDELQTMNKKLENMSNNITWEFENNIGRLYSDKSYNTEYTNATLDVIKDKVEQQRANKYKMQSWEKLIDEKYGNSTYAQYLKKKLYDNGIKDDTIEQYDKAILTGSAYDAQLATLYAERDNYERQIEDEQSKKDVDNNKVAEYTQSYEEAKQAIADFAKEQAEALYGIDFESYAENIASTLVDAWSSGTKSVKAYKEAVADMLKSVITNVIQQKIIGKYLDEYVDAWMEKLNDSSGVMTEDLYEELVNIFKGLETQVDAAKEVYDAAYNAAKEAGYDWEDSSSSTLSSNIQGVTEDTADLLASYLNAIRADVSINRAMFESLALETIPAMSTDINLSLQQLKGIKATLDAMAYNVESIHDMMNDMTLGNKKMYVVMKNIA